jgi:GAF domain-containing protein
MFMDSRIASLLDLPTEGAHSDALRIALELGISTVGAEEGSLLVLDDSSGDLVFLMTAGDMLSESVLKGQRVPVGQGLTGRAASTGEIQVGVPTHASVLQSEHRNEKSPSRLIAAPMFAGKQLTGVLTAATYQPEHQFLEEQIRVFGRIAALAGIVVAERRRILSFESLHAGAPLGATADEKLNRQFAETIWRLTQGDDSRLRSLLQLLEKVERLAER